LWHAAPNPKPFLTENSPEFTRRLQMLNDDGLEKIYKTA
jgi:hypothetical protein